MTAGGLFADTGYILTYLLTYLIAACLTHIFCIFNTCANVNSMSCVSLNKPHAIIQRHLPAQPGFQSPREDVCRRIRGSYTQRHAAIVIFGE